MVVGDITTGTDVLVIGGGPAGYVAAIRAGQLDLDVTLVEREAYGGTCLNHGCIPSKALISATDIAHRAGSAEEMGIHADPAIDLAAMVGWKDDIVEQFTGGVEKLCKANGVTLIDGTAVFADDTTARISSDGEGEGSESIAFEHAIIATGSRPMSIPDFPFEDDRILDSRAVLSLTETPESVVVIGAGYIGMELASVLAKLGTDVTVVEMRDAALPGYDADLVKPVLSRARSLDIEFHFERTASGWSETDSGITVHTESTAEDDDLDIDAEYALVAVGREPVTETVDLEAAGIETDDDGFIPTDDRTKTTVDTIHAVGDVAGEPMLAHAGSIEGKVAAEVIAGEPAALDHRAMPAVVFTDPEIATVGLDAAAAEEAGYDPVVGRFPCRASGRAITMGRTDGFVRIVAEGEHGFVLGGQIVAAEASELIAEIALAVELGATLEDVAATVHTHPTMAETVQEAAEHALGRAIHTLNR